MHANYAHGVKIAFNLKYSQCCDKLSSYRDNLEQYDRDDDICCTLYLTFGNNVHNRDDMNSFSLRTVNS